MDYAEKHYSTGGLLPEASALVGEGRDVRPRIRRSRSSDVF